MDTVAEIVRKSGVARIRIELDNLGEGSVTVARNKDGRASLHRVKEKNNTISYNMDTQTLTWSSCFRNNRGREERQERRYSTKNQKRQIRDFRTEHISRRKYRSDELVRHQQTTHQPAVVVARFVLFVTADSPEHYYLRQSAGE
jgi:hypothetical protein